MIEPLSFVDSGGMPERVGVWEAGPDDPSYEWGSPFRTRTVRFEDGRSVIQQRLLAAHAGQHEARDALEAEIRTGLTLIRTFPPRSYPPEFTRLAGYNVDTEEPYLLLDPLRGGQPTSEFAGRLLVREQQRFDSSVFRALRLLEWAGLVHRSINPSTVRWDGSRVQLTAFGSAEEIGRPRQRIGALPWVSPEQWAADGETDPRDDVWSGGQLIYFVTTGRQPVIGRTSTAGQQALSDLLKGVFDDRIGRRPTARALLRRVAAVDPCDTLGRAPDPLEPGYRGFDGLLDAKGPHVWPVRPTGAPQPEKEPFPPPARPGMPDPDPDPEPDPDPGERPRPETPRPSGGNWARRRGRGTPRRLSDGDGTREARG